MTNGVIKHLTEGQLMSQSGIDFSEEEWDHTKGVLGVFEELEMIRISGDGVITVSNWGKRQEAFLSNAQRQAKFRNKNKDSNGKVTKPRNESNARIEENRIDKKRINTASNEAFPHKKRGGMIGIGELIPDIEIKL